MSEALYVDPICAADLGRRAKTLREQRTLSLEELSCLIGHDSADIERFEQTGQGSVDLLLALARAISFSGEFEDMLTLPKFNSLDEVEAYEIRRLAAQPSFGVGSRDQHREKPAHPRAEGDQDEPGIS